MGSQNQSWIWHPDWKEDSTGIGAFVHFRKLFELESVPGHPVAIEITADTRYKLYVNSQPVHYGPVKGDTQLWFYDEIDIQPFLQRGTNLIAVRVLRLCHGSRFGTTLPRTRQGGLWVRLFSPKCVPLGIDILRGWQTALDTTTKLVAHEEDRFLHISESTDTSVGMTKNLNWVTAQNLEIFTAYGLLAPWKLMPRSIPFHLREPVNVATIHNLESTVPLQDWQRVLFRKHGSLPSPLHLPANTSHHLVLGVNSLTTAFFSLLFRRSPSSVNNLQVTYAECYEDLPADMTNPRQKSNRCDTSKYLVGFSDTFTFGGNAASPPAFGYRADEHVVEAFEPFHFRTFRYIGLDIKVGEDSDLIFMGVEITRTGYPLVVKGSFHVQSDIDDFVPDQLWTTSIVTLENCMHDCYEDCPFYEQLQYGQDTRSSALFTYCVADDDRLARQALLQLHHSFQPAIGLTASRAPCEHLQIIPNFSLYWICSVVDHFEYYGDSEFTVAFLPVCDAVLESFRRRMDSKTGLIRSYDNDDYWDFVDWTNL